jgi:hypothetical protein
LRHRQFYAEASGVYASLDEVVSIVKAAEKGGDGGEGIWNAYKQAILDENNGIWPKDGRVPMDPMEYYKRRNEWGEGWSKFST